MGESLPRYRRRLANLFKQHSPDFKSADLSLILRSTERGGRRTDDLCRRGPRRTTPPRSRAACSARNPDAYLGG
jgi:hypothetical protein